MSVKMSGAHEKKDVLPLFVFGKRNFHFLEYFPFFFEFMLDKP